MCSCYSTYSGTYNSSGHGGLSYYYWRMKYPCLIRWSGVNSPGTVPPFAGCASAYPGTDVPTAPRGVRALQLYRCAGLILVIPPPHGSTLNSPIAPHHVSVSPTVNMNSKLHSGRSRIRSLEDCPSAGGDESIKPTPITLVDHTVTPSENSPSLWARNAKVVDYVIVSGSRTRAGAYVAWNCLIETFEVCAVRSIFVLLSAGFGLM